MALEQSPETATRQSPDYDDIVRVVQLYVDGFNDGDVEKFKEAFHEAAWIFFTQPDGSCQSFRIAEAFELWASQGAHIASRIISVAQAGDIASVLLGFDNVDDLADGWVDFHALLRINGVWKITNKTATHCSRAAWAAPIPPQHE